jgi:uncharacterized membrane protein
MWRPSRFAFRLAYTTALLGYFVVRETRKVKATVVQVLACVLFAGAVHLAIGFGCRQAIGQLPGISFAAWGVVELFFLVQLLVLVIQHLNVGHVRNVNRTGASLSSGVQTTGSVTVS